MKNTCIITFCDTVFLNKAKETISDIIDKGKYEGSIVLMVGNDLYDTIESLSSEFDGSVIVKYFPNIDRSTAIEKMKGIQFGDGRQYTKMFQWHKIHCFDVYFKRWNSCLLVDAGTRIFKPIDKIFNIEHSNRILAHSDSYPEYNRFLENQFEKINFSELYEKLNEKYDLSLDYFQSTVMLYDTKIIKDNTVSDLINLGNIYYNCKTNEQGILNLYFQKMWKQIKIKDDETYYYDFVERNNTTYKDYIMLKYPRTFYEIEC